MAIFPKLNMNGKSTLVLSDKKMLMKVEKFKGITETFAIVEDVSFPAHTRERSGDIHTFGFVFWTNVVPLTLINVGASQSIAHVAKIAHTLVSNSRTVAKASTVAGWVT